MSNHTLTLTPKLEAYLHRYGVTESSGLKALRAETVATLEAAPMLISPEQGQFFQWLLKTMHAKHVLEIGTFTGYSAACMAQALPESGSVTCCDLSYDWTRLAVKHWEKMGLQEKITLHLAPALDTLPTLLEKHADHYDFAFIDADKPNYPHYFEYCLKLVRPGGVIAIDNVLWGGEVANENNQDENTRVIRALNENLSHDPRVFISMLPIGDGLTLAQKLVPVGRAPM